MAAVLAEGRTILRGCACEPEVGWLCSYLNGMGAKIFFPEKDIICIEGVKRLRPGDGVIPPDRIVAGTYLLAAAATRGEIIIEASLGLSWKYIGKWVDNMIFLVVN